MAAAWLASADDPDARSDALMEMARARLGPAIVTPNPLAIAPDALRRIANRPEVRARFDLLARDLPASFNDAWGRWRGAE